MYFCFEIRQIMMFITFFWITFFWPCSRKEDSASLPSSRITFGSPKVFRRKVHGSSQSWWAATCIQIQESRTRLTPRWMKNPLSGCWIWGGWLPPNLREFKHLFGSILMLSPDWKDSLFLWFFIFTGWLYSKEDVYLKHSQVQWNSHQTPKK